MTSDDSKRPIPLVKLAHLLVKDSIKPGDIVIDATVGNGYDTAFLIDLVKPDGHVYGFDVQQAAIDTATNLLNDRWKVNCLTLIRANHAAMLDYIPSVHRGHIKLVMFNLGYLPGSDKQVKTRSESTLAALNSASLILSDMGMITVLAYPGHEGGDIETIQVSDWCRNLDPSNYRVSFHENHPENPAAPKLFVVTKIG